MTLATIPPKRGNGKTLNEIEQRAKKSVARIEAEKRIAEANATVTQMKRITELRAQARDLKIDNYVKQEVARAPQIQIDQRKTLWLLGALAAVMFIATAVLSADGTIGAATAAKFATPVFGYILFGAVEIAILVFLLVYYILGSRMDYDGKRETSVQWFIAMIAASIISVALSGYHVLTSYNFDWSSVGLYVGVVIRVVVTLFFVLVSKAIAKVLFAKAVEL